jgi:hypothetical protein
VLEVSGAENPGNAAASVPSLRDIDRYREITAYPAVTDYSPNSDLPARRRVDIPLTYEDLAVPIDQPKPIVERFSATASVRQQQLDAEKIAGLVMPPLETLPIEQQHELMRSAQQITGSNPSSANSASGRLASVSSLSSLNSEETGARPTKPSDAKAMAESGRERFWIRQPK